MTDQPGLLADIGSVTGLSQEQCEALAGTIIGAIQTSLPAAVFGDNEKAVPDARALSAKSTSPLGGRTGEIALVMAQLKTADGANRIREQLTRKGLTAEQVKRGADAVVRYLQGRLGNKAVEGLLGALPGLTHLMN